jgi:hypothetical protein
MGILYQILMDSMKHWWNDTGRGKQVLHVKPAKCHFIHHKFYMDCLDPGLILGLCGEKLMNN